MKYYPILLNVKEKKCIVFGGGLVAERKVNSLFKCQSWFHVVSLEITGRLGKYYDKRKIIWTNSKYNRRFLKKSFLIIAATDDADINSKIYKDAQSLNIWINVVDSPKECDFILPAVANKGNLTISVSTNGKLPCLSKAIKKELQKTFLSRYSKILNKLAGVRKKLMRTCPDYKRRKVLLSELVNKYFR